MVFVFRYNSYLMFFQLQLCLEEWESGFQIDKTLDVKVCDVKYKKILEGMERVQEDSDHKHASRNLRQSWIQQAQYDQI